MSSLIDRTSACWRFVAIARRLANTFVRGAGVGAVATVIDLFALTFVIEIFGWDPKMANVPALLCGAGVQFVGSRHLVFEASSGSLVRQGLGFSAVEIVTLILNAGLFHLLVDHGVAGYPALRLLVSAAVFALFSFPLWRCVFRHSAAENR